MNDNNDGGLIRFRTNQCIDGYYAYEETADPDLSDLYGDIEEPDEEEYGFAHSHHHESEEDMQPVQLENPEQDDTEPLGHVIGHANQKKEILSVLDWFKHSAALKARGVSIPHGILLFGAAGNGKSLIIKEIIRFAKVPTYIFNGDQTNVVEGINKIFRLGRASGHAIIVFDELDLLIDRDSRVIRALQENLDGVESSDDILVLAATNNLREIPGPLKRNGRLEKIIEIPYPTEEEALELLKKYFHDFGLPVPEGIDEGDVGLLLTGISCAGIKAVVNDVILRNGFEGITVEMVETSIHNVSTSIKTAPYEDNLEVSIHEAGHAAMANLFPQHFRISSMNVAGASGAFHCREVEKGFWPYDKVLADIQISLSGILAQKLLCGRGSFGCEEDLQRARRAAYRVLNLAGYDSCWETLPPYGGQGRTDTPKKRRRMERKAEALLRKCERKATRFVRAHAATIRTLGQLLYEKKRLKPSEIHAILG